MFMMSGVRAAFFRFMEGVGVWVYDDPNKWEKGNPWDILVLDKSLYRDLFLGLEVGFMRAYTRNKWMCRDLEQLAQRLYTNGAPKPKGRSRLWFAIPLCRYYLLPTLFQKLGFNPQNLWRSKRAVAAHYDMLEALIQPMLGDEYMVYSCADFRPDTYAPERDLDCTLEQAQERKIENLCRKLRLKPYDRVLDIGCGYGDVLAYIVENCSVQGVGITLSRAQFSIACERHARLIAEGRLEFRVQDYRDIPFGEMFDKVVSVGMLEHVGRANLWRYMYDVYCLLEDGGLALVHSITSKESQFLQNPWIRTDIFRDSFLPSLAQVDAAAAELLELRNTEELPYQYAYTLREWRKRYHGALDTPRFWSRLVGAFGGPRAREKSRMWDIYLAFCAAAFALKHISVHQWVFSKGQLGEPYAYEPYRRAAVRESEQSIHA